MFKQEKWRLHEQALLLRRLGELLEKGYSLLHALEFLHFHLTPRKQTQLQDAAEEFKKGSSLHDVFDKLAFHPDILSYLFYAEQHGDISFALQQGSLLLSRKDKHQKSMMKVLRYPFVLSLFLLGMLLVFNMVLLPQFSTLYRSLQGSSSSAFTDNILTFIQALPYVVGGGAFVIGMAVLIYMVYVKKLHPVTRMHICMRVPLVRLFLKLTNSHYFAIQLSGLLQGGLSILEALTLMKEQKHHLFFQCEALSIQELLTVGEHLDSIMMNRPYYEQELSYIIKHGQANGNLATELADYSEMTIEKIEEKLNRILFTVQPILFTCIGMVVILMYLAMIMPMFQMMNSI